MGRTEHTGNKKMRNLVIPGFDGVPISHVFNFVIRGFRKGVLVTRASSIAFNMLMAPAQGKCDLILACLYLISRRKS